MKTLETTSTCSGCRDGYQKYLQGGKILICGQLVAAGQ